jgi:hypothetical protein
MSQRIGGYARGNPVALNELQLSSAMENITELEWRPEDHTFVIYAYKPEKIGP